MMYVLENKSPRVWGGGRVIPVGIAKEDRRKEEGKAVKGKIVASYTFT